MLKTTIKLCLITTLLIFNSRFVNAQDSKLGTWGIATIVMPGDSAHRWGGYSEFQLRTNGVGFSQFQYYEAKAGVSYDIDKNFIALLGTGTYHTYNYLDIADGPTINEFRVWEQMTINQFLTPLKFEHRYRVEQRWLDGNYRNRFRYRLNMFIPLNNVKIVAKTWFISVFDEIFFNNKAPNFERNRVSAALGYQFDKKWIVQAGWINQRNYTTTTSSAKNNIMLTLMYRINRKNSPEREHLPTTSD
ncbi:DUF2490 domain-containing protein [Mucilaginibacter achroorhodeus]|uniref:DUF2490 domain-containing protein n=1 Tax=Mucilaginibacter achroorhodeus TaxID=2599294 RepID=A0A563TYU8_9SPHI|nr:DUF2490 domain-containing protein [Mucilaginibacter achroorhodeus]TWR24545.1 DUF2490 domain-containing protein [Mucilaginibacter achroorhodeus]